MNLWEKVFVWFDQVRYGTWKEDTEAKFERYNFTELKANLKEGRYLYPIPMNQIECYSRTLCPKRGILKIDAICLIIKAKYHILALATLNLSY